MGFFPYMFAFLLLVVVVRARVSHDGVANLNDQQIYWNNVLPNTPMPKAISVLLRPTDAGEKGDSNAIFSGGVRDANEKGPIFLHGGSGGARDAGEKGDSNPLFYGSYGGARDAGEKGDSNPLFYGGYGGARDAGEKGDSNPLFYGSYGGARDAGEKGDGNQIFWYGGARDAGEKGDSNVIIYANKLRRANSDDNSHSIAALGDMFFFEKVMHPGKTMKTTIARDSSRSSPFMSQKLAESVPFSSTRFPDVLNQFSVKPGSKEANKIQENIQLCENAPIRGEEKHCFTSLESMIDYVTSKFGTNNIQAISTEVGKGATKNRNTYTIIGRAKKLAMASDRSIVCHKISDQFTIFACHEMANTRAYMVPLEGVDGSKANAVAPCHVDTSAWNPNHVSFQILKAKPGEGPICHFLAESDILWVRNDQEPTLLHQSIASVVA